ncbi:MAG: hypothetical protein CVU88_01570 [Firmicutes bacterium HGW-Firmicutes-13]|nr:MAG: hypothetical protein CVU88_01570 [Firmicutes bacterium HGW-Firmicutes-13]
MFYTKPLFKGAFLNKRCIITVDGFYEWKKESGRSVKYRVELKDNSLFSLAGIYDDFVDMDGTPFTGFTIITTASNRLIAGIHNRMPVILSEDTEDIWLDKDIKDAALLRSFLKPCEDEEKKLEAVGC